MANDQTDSDTSIADRVADAITNEPADDSVLEQCRKSRDPIAAAQLYSLMSDISEDYWCAGWMSGNEDALWLVLHGGDTSYGMGGIDAVEVAALKRLHEKCGGWWYWHDNEKEPGLDSAQWGPRFVTTDEWIGMVRYG